MFRRKASLQDIHTSSRLALLGTIERLSQRAENILQALSPVRQLEDRVPGPEKASLACIVLATLPVPDAGLEIRFFELGTEVVADAAAVALPVFGGVGDVGVEVDAVAEGLVGGG